MSDKMLTYPKWTEYIRMHYNPDSLIDRHPNIANGWTRDELRQMTDFFWGAPIIVGGLLRLLPSPAKTIPVTLTVSATAHLIRLAEGHIRAGRLPLLKDSTKKVLLEKALQHEIKEYGHPLQPTSRTGVHRDSSQRSLFE